MMNLLSALVVAAALPFTPAAVHHLENADGTLRAETGVLSPPMPQDVRDAARTYALGRPDLRLPPGGSYGPARAFSSRHWATVRMPQLIDGVEVAGAELVVSFDRSRRVMQVSSSVQRYEGYTTYALTAAEAHQRAGLAVEGAVYRGEGHFYGGVKRQYLVRGTEARAAYLAWIPTLRPDENWYVAVDAVNGEVLFKQNRVHHGFAANVYASSPGGNDGGVGVAATQQVELQNLDGGVLSGTWIKAWNCCTTEGCVEGAGPKRITGQTNVGGFPVQFNVAVCDRVQRATNETTADYLYTPVDPPSPVCTPTQGCVVRAGDPAAEDLFAETHAYHHVDRVYAWTRALATAADGTFAADNLQPFQLRDAAQGRVPSVWANALMPNINEAFQNLGTSTTLTHLDNAAFVPREQFSQPPFNLPGLAFDTDALIIWQGPKADFSYDAPVLWHEFGHGMIYSSANIDFGAIAYDARSANNEGGALHEGLADYVAVAYGNDSQVGAYVGPRIDGVREQNLLGGNVIPAGEALRDANNPYKCPDVLWGEVHQDGMHLTAALWDARKGDFAGTDGGATFDAVVYAAIVSLAPNAGFAEFAAAVVARVQLAFPGVTGAAAKMQAIFDNRGITGCNKLVDITGKAAPQRPVFFISDGSGAGFARTAQIPGPVQFKVTLPKGAKSVSVTFPAPQDGFTGQAQQVNVKLLARYGDPITFTRTSTTFESDATASGSSAVQGSNVKVTTSIDVPCGQELYLALTGAGGPQLRGLTFTTEDADSCPVADAGTPEQPGDAGTPGADAGTDDGGGAPAPKSGCGCGATDAGAVMLPALALLVLRRRRVNTAR